MLAQQWKKTISQTVNRLCPLCHLPLTPGDGYWCSYCLNWFRPVPRCLRCGLPMRKETQQCGQCLISPPPWHRLTCLGDYAFPLSHYIHQIKHQRHFDIIAPLARLLSERIPQERLPECLTYVPLHWRRFFIRGFNQSERLAYYLAQYHHLPLRACFKKHRHTRPQQQLNRAQRLTNLTQAFSLTHPPDAKRIAIVDDVVTTGATLSVLCEKMLESGLETIDIYCICRTPDPD